ncbi:hypothetical protein [Actinoplanes utahensis]|uniref:vWA-MoxR associated protein C-terminal domain-containing protein n=1 Tax=Actinoplanes utahensis TaxID=1869 RepID=A0A0A6UH76_ACTUT|nr:hypothetical protein [Actinoplanes utahensis]KHD75390.1 hypothetical protein MB27_23465 [Actinoplanes utahensis]GIF33696.1 hypothetical protein Aut01nite_66820 [Actinoplanes utahensis]
MTAAGERDRVVLGGATLLDSQRRQLVAALVRVGLDDWETRSAVIRRVRARRDDFDFPHTGRSYLADINAMLAAALTDGDILDDLLDEIGLPLPADDPAWVDLLTLIPTMLPRSPLTKRELAALLAVDLPEPPSPGQLSRVARELWPRGPQRADLFTGVRATALTLLGGVDLRGGMCRLVRFAWWLGRYARDLGDSAPADRFEEWARQVTGRHALTVAAGWEPPSVEASAADPPALLVELDPDVPRRGAYAVHLRVWRPGSGLEPLTGWPGENDYYRPEELEQRLGELIGLAAARFGDTGPRLRVEFQVDDDLVHYTADRWRLATRRRGPFPPLGAERQVLIRPRRQPLDPEERQDWARRWRQLRTGGRRLGELCVWVPDETAYDEMALWSHFDEHPDGVLVVPVGPPEKVEEKLCELLHQSVHGGLPIALCVRRDPDRAAEVLAWLRRQLDGRPVADLPEQVRAWRRDAARTPGHFGADLILLWDDYDRWPDARFSNPAVVPEEAA